MTRHDLRAQLESLDLSQRLAEEPHRAAMIALLDTAPDCFHRTCFPGHFTASALVVSADGSQALLNHHRKLQRWLHFGGHCDGDTDVTRVAQREALEECGITGLILASARPFDLDVHPIPAIGSEPAHDHYDVNFVLIAPEGARECISDESTDLRWFTPEQMLDLPLSESMRRVALKWQALRDRRTHAARVA